MPTAEMKNVVENLKNDIAEDYTMQDFTINEYKADVRVANFDAWTRDLPSNQMYTAMH